MSDYLYNAISVLGEIDKEKYEELKAYFAGAPKWLIDSFQIVRMEKDYTFIRENEPVRYIYLVIEGIVRNDYRIYGIVYDFMKSKHTGSNGRHGAGSGIFLHTRLP